MSIMSSRNSFSLLFYINRSKQKKNGQFPLMLRITLGGRSVAISLKRSIEADIWNPSSGLAKGKSHEATGINQFIDAIRVRTYDKHNELLTRYDEVTAELLRDALLNVNTSKGKTLVQIWEEHNRELKETLKENSPLANWKRYCTGLGYMKEFLLKHCKAEDILIKMVDRNFVLKFQHFLKVEKLNNHNQVMKYSQNLKKLTKMAQLNGWLTHDPFATITLTVKEVSRPYLTELELKAIIEQKIDKEPIARVRDMFVFSCFTGLAHADVRKLKRSELELNPNGKQWIRIARKKTKVRAHIPVLAVVDQIIQKYVNDSSNSDSPILPTYTNQNTNRYLKVIARNAGIEKNLSFHIARHTFATTVTLMNGVPIESVSKMLGHKNIQSTQHYAKIVDEKVGADMELLAMRLESKMNW